MINLNQHSVSKEIVYINGQAFEIDKYVCSFKKWNEEILFNTYGGKAILNVNGEALFAELVVLRLLTNAGYDCVWADTYKRKFWRDMPHLSSPVELSPNIKKVYEEICEKRNGKNSGCFDIIANKNDTFLFAELKRSKKDKIRQSQLDWLEHAVNINCKKTFIIVEWDF